MMNAVLAPLLRKCVIVFIDDVLIYSKTLEEHVEHVKQVLQLLEQNQLYLKLSKCLFAKEKLEFLGHVISKQGVSTDPSKISTMQKWPAPGTVKELRRFLGMAGSYRKFVKHFGEIAKPLTNLLKKGALFTWTSECQQAFQTLKQALTEALVLALPNFKKQFVVETYASDKGIGAVLQQEGHPVAYISRALGSRNQGLSTYEKECMAILFAVEHLRMYLQHAEFVIKTDQKSLVHLQDQRLTTPWQCKALTKLLGLQYRLVYKKGVENKVADALSRKSSVDAEILQMSCPSVSFVKPMWLEEVTQGYQQDPQALKLLAELAVGKVIEHYSLRDGLIRFKGRVWLGNNPELQQKVIMALHSSAIGGHSGFPMTYRRIKSVFAWPSCKQCVQAFVARCSMCQQAKPDQARYPGLLVPLPVPQHAWQMVTMDFIERLPTSHHYNCILVVVDKFSKYSHFVPLTHPFTAL